MKNAKNPRNVIVLYLTQNVFHKRHMRTISLNSHYRVLFKNPRDAGQSATLARQMYPNASKFAVEDATERPSRYLFVVVVVVPFFNHNFVNCKATCTLIWRLKIYEIKYNISLNDVHTNDVDLKPDQEEQYRLRRNIFPGENHYVYVRK